MADDRVYYTDGLIGSLEHTLRAALSQPSLTLSRKPSNARGHFASEIRGSRKFWPSDSEEGQDIIDVRGAKIPDGLFWLAFKAEFEFWKRDRRDRHFLNQISLSLFQSTSAGLIRMFRAEWDSRESERGHAQPHWHFAMKADDFMAALSAALPVHQQDEGSEFVSSARPISLVDVTHFHFAMSAPWQSGVPLCHCQTLKSNDQVKSWLRDLSRYIVHQLEYVSGKLRLSPVEVQEFSFDDIHPLS